MFATSIDDTRLHGSAELPCEVSWQASLFGLDPPSVDAAMPGLERDWLDESSWVDHLPRWLTGSDHVFAELVARVAWRQRRVRMYDRLVDEPRLTWWWDKDDGEEALPLPLLAEMSRAFSDRYERPFDSVGLNFYRDGHDSVAWHGDRVARRQIDPIVAIVSVGAPRPFLVRPHGGGGASRAYLLGQGDVLVMGGSTQRDWEHAVPKVAAAGPRISITYRHDAPESQGVSASNHPAAWTGRRPPVGRARSSTSRNEDGEMGCHDARGVRVREHPTEIEAS